MKVIIRRNKQTNKIVDECDEYNTLTKNGKTDEKIAKYKRRAEVAERQAIFLSKMLADKTRKDYPWQAWFDAAQKQAEKELAEEESNAKN